MLSTFLRKNISTDLIKIITCYMYSSYLFKKKLSYKNNGMHWLLNHNMFFAFKMKLLPSFSLFVHFLRNFSTYLLKSLKNITFKHVLNFT